MALNRALFTGPGLALDGGTLTVSSLDLEVEFTGTVIYLHMSLVDFPPKVHSKFGTITIVTSPESSFRSFQFPSTKTTPRKKNYPLEKTSFPLYKATS